MPHSYPKPLPRIERLQSLFCYDQETGLLTWKAKPSKRVCLGAAAGSDTGRAYLRVKIAGVIYPVHRVCYALGSGVAPAPNETVDHINGIRDDNRFVNLRLAVHFEQMQNNHRPKPRTLPGNLHLPRGVSPVGLGYRAVVTVRNLRGERRILRQTFPDYLQAGYAAALLREHYHGQFAQHGADTPERFRLLIDPPAVTFPELE